MTPDAQLQQCLETFPPAAWSYLQTIPDTGGMLSPGQCLAIMETIKMSAEDLMLRLLPMARLYSATAISGFQVGAVAKAWMSDNDEELALFLGANLEFPAQTLIQAIHAEQSAIINAWLQGAKQIESIAVTAAPCGYCRQFLRELEGGQDLKILIDDRDVSSVKQHNLSDLLPAAFGPHDLGSATGLMSSTAPSVDLKLASAASDPLVLKAMAAAQKSYAPYTRNFAGCAIKTAAGKIYTGRYAENAAFNPSLSALHTAIIRLNMDQPGTVPNVRRAVLVEKPTSISQRAACELLLQTLAPNVELEYFKAVKE